jgi:hypothetical protein
MTENPLPFHENFPGSPGFPIAIGETENDMSSGVIASPIKVSFIESDCGFMLLAGQSIPEITKYTKQMIMPRESLLTPVGIASMPTPDFRFLALISITEPAYAEGGS